MKTPPARTAIFIAAAMCTTMHAMTMSVVNVVLPQLRGSLSATPDQISWVVTLYVLGAAVATPMLGWLVERFGWRWVLTGSVGLFGVMSYLCAIAESLEALLFFRLCQGLVGAPLTPVSQAVLLAIYTEEERTWSQGVFGALTVVGQSLAPVLGGYLAETYDWRWIFALIVPSCAVTFALCIAYLPDGGKDKDAKLDWTGFLSLSVAIICFQLMVDRGERLDWFESGQIIVLGCGAALALYFFVAHTMTHPRPYISPRIFLDRNFVLGTALIFLFGMVAFVPMVTLPPLLKTLKGYPDFEIGLLIALRGVGMMGGFLLASVIGRFDPRVGIVIGFGCAAATGMQMALFDFNVEFSTVAWVSVVQGAGVGMLWVPITVIAFATLPARLLAQATGVWHVVRHLGASLFVSITVATIVHSSSINYAEISQRVNPFNESLKYPSVIGAWNQGTLAGLTELSDEISRQAQMVGYLNGFVLYTVVALFSIALAMLARMRRRGEGTP